jgi:WD40 repeat protein
MAMLTGIRGPAADVAFSPLREEVAFVTTQGLVGLWTPGSTDPARQLAQQPEGYARVVWLPSGEQLLTVDRHGRARVFDRTSGSLLRSFETGAGDVQSIALCPQGRYLAASSYFDSFSVCDLEQPEHKPWHTGDSSVTGFAFHRRSGRLFMALSDYSLVAWMPGSAQRPRVVGVLDQTGELAPWGEDRLLVIGSRCGVFDIALGTILPPLFIGWDDVSSLVELPGTKDLLVANAVGGGEDAVGRFGTSERRMLRTATPAASQINALAVLPDGSGVVTATRQISLWSASEGRLLRRESGHVNLVQGLAAAHDSRSVFSIGQDERVGVTELGAPGGTHAVRPGLDMFDGIAAAPLSNEFATAGIMSGLVVWDGAGRRLRLHPDKPGIGALSVAYAPNGRRLVLGLTDGEVMVYDTRSWQIERRFWVSRTGAAQAFAFAPDGERLLIADGGSDALIVEVPSGRPIQVLTGHASAPRVVAWSPLGPVIAIGAEDGILYLWDAETMRMRHRLAAHDGAVTGAAFSPDGQILYSASEDGSFALWRVSDGKLLAKVMSLRTGDELIVYADGRAIWTTAPDDHAVWAEHVTQGLSTSSAAPRVLQAPRLVAQLLAE